MTALPIVAARAAIVVSNLDPANADFGFNAPTIGQAIQLGNRPIVLSSIQLLQTGGLTTGEVLSVTAATLTAPQAPRSTTASAWRSTQILL